MRSGVRVLSLGLILLTAVSVATAQDGTKKGKKKVEPGTNNAVFQLPKEVTLTAEQQAKLDALKKEHGPKLAELQKKLDELLSAEQIQARKDALAKAKTDMLKGKAAQEAALAALKLTPDQKAKWEAAQKEMQAHQGKVREKLAEFLTEEQKAKIPALSRKKKNA